MNDTAAPAGLDWRQCEAFLAVADSGSFEQAATRLHLTPSAVSLRLRELESRLGRPLLVRTRPCRATPDGQRLLQHLRRARALEAEFLADLAGDDAAPLVLPLAVNADSLATWLLPVLAAALAGERVLVDLAVDDQEHTYPMLQAGLVSACITSEPQALRGCVAEPLGAMRYRLVATPAFVQQWFARGFTRAAARRAPAVVFNRKDRLHATLLMRIHRLPEDAFPRHHVPASEPFVAAIRMGLGYGVVPDLQLGNALARGELVDLAPAAVADVALHWHRWRLQSPRLERLTQRAVAAARQRLAAPGACTPPPTSA